MNKLPLFLITFLISTATLFGQQIPQEILDFKQSRYTSDFPTTITPQNAGAKGQQLGTPPNWTSYSPYVTEGRDVANDVVVDANNNIYTTGFFHNDLDVNGPDPLNSVGVFDLFILKQNDIDGFVWIKSFNAGSTGEVKGNSISFDPDGNILVTGSFTETLEIGATSLVSSGKEDLFIAKFNSVGQAIWAVSYGDNDYNVGGDIAVDANGNSYIVAHDGSSEANLGTKSILKYDSNGLLVTTFSNGAFFHEVNVVNGLLHITGVIQTTTDFGSTTLSMNGYQDAFLAQADLNFNFQWAIGHMPPSGQADSFTTGMASTANGDIFLCGNFSGVVQIGSLTHQGIGTFITKYDTAGNLLWSNISTDHDYRSYNKITVSPTGQVYLAGNYRGKLHFSGMLPSYSSFLQEYVLYFNANGQASNGVTESVSTNALAFSPDNHAVRTSDYWQFQVDKRNPFNTTWESTNDNYAGSSGSLRGGIEAIEDQGTIHMDTYIRNCNFLGLGLQTVDNALFVTNVNDNEQVVWYKQFHILGSLFDSRIKVAADGNVFVAGSFEGSLDVSDGNLYLSEDNENFIAKLSSSGDLLWIKFFKGNATIWSLENSGNDLIVAGTYTDTPLLFSSQNLALPQLEDLFILKLNPQGDLLWAKQAGGEDIEYLGVVSTDANQNIYLAAEVLSFNFEINGSTTTLAEGDGNTVLVKLNANGDTQFVKAYGGGISNPIDDYLTLPIAMETDLQGNSYMLGWCAAHIKFGSIALNSPRDFTFNWFIAKIDTNGDVLWANMIEQKSSDQLAFDLTLDANGNVYFGGGFRDSIYFDNAPFFPSSPRDLMVARYNTDGTLGWVKTINGGENSPIRRISTVEALDEDYLVVAGYFEDKLYFDGNPISTIHRAGFRAILGEEPSGVGQENDNHFLLSVFPNPSSDYINVRYTVAQSGAVQLHVYDMLGKRVLAQDLGDNSIGEQNASLDIKKLPVGNYLLQVRTKTSFASQKFEKF